jgi:RNA polymerase subunit RPABC4/transcription elongation factor Spt4
MPVCFSCGETVDDDSPICPHCFGNVAAPAQGTPDVETAVVLDDDESFDDEITLAPLEEDTRDHAETRPDATSGVSEPIELNKETAVAGRCPNCHGLLGTSADLCTLCGYHFGLKRTLTAEEEPDEQDLGLRRAMRRSLNDDASLVHVSILAHVTLVVIAGFFYIQFTILRWVLIPLFIGYVAFRVADLLGRGRYIRRAERFVWLRLLQLIRAIGWRDPRRPSKRLKVMQATGGSFDDEKMLAAEPKLAGFDAIDLNGSAISDDGLAALFGKPNLRYIVLLNTKISYESVIRLQRNHQDAWIWW